jgi:hypothetical protein
MHNNEIFCTWERADKTVTLQEQNIKEHDITQHPHTERVQRMAMACK